MGGFKNLFLHIGYDLCRQASQRQAYILCLMQIQHRFLTMKALVVVVTFKKKKALVLGDFFGHSEVSRSPIDSSRGE